MTIKVTLWEFDDVVAHPDAQSLREYPIAEADTIQHAMRIATAKQSELSKQFTYDTVRFLDVYNRDGFDRFSFKMVGDAHDKPGDVWRTTWVSVSIYR